MPSELLVMMNSRIGASFALAILFLSLAAPTLLAAEEDGVRQARSAPLWVESASSANILGAASPYAELAEAASPAVVNVLVAYDQENLPPSARRSRVPGSESLGQGSGFIIHPDGHIVTNFHVIDHASSIQIRLSDEAEFDAQVIGVDPDTDLALLKIEAPEELPAIPLGRSSALRPGEFVIAIGNPLGLNHSVTAGIVSAVGRRDLPIEGAVHRGHFIQTDTPINPGNSGGPLINMNGEVVGINTAVNRNGQGISFAIPIDTVKTLLPQLHDRGYVLRSWLGVRIQPLDLPLARSFQLQEPSGALVTEVLPDSPASRAGIMERDVILKLNDEPIESSERLPWLVSTTPGGTEVIMTLFRNGELVELPVELDAIPNQNPPSLPGAPQSPERSAPLSGIEVTELTTRLARQLAAPDEKGVVVTSLSDSSPARSAGLRHRDVIVEVGSREVLSPQDFQTALEEIDDGEIIRLRILRRGRAIYMAFTK